MNGAMRDPRLVLLATSLGVLLAQIDTSVVNLGLKSIARELSAGVSEMQWVIDAYNVVYATLLLTAGTLGDIYGRRRIFLLGITLFTAGTIVCALAPNAVVLIVGRASSRTGRGICAADVAGPVDPRLSAPRGTRPCDGYLGELQRACFHHRPDVRRLARGQRRLAKHFLYEPASLRGGPVSHAVCN